LIASRCGQTPNGGRGNDRCGVIALGAVRDAHEIEAWALEARARWR
jgi:hypothetical protein